ncbi:MAG: SpoIIE family protein phosphatase [Bacteroidales bacterium]|nr:SpoIIE family protein phosphatase [Bacteroidales bacterium]
MKPNKIKKPLISVLLLLLIPLIVYPQTIEQQIAENDALANKYLAEGKESEAARIFNQTAYLLRANNNTSKAIEYYEKVLGLNISLGNKVGQMLTHSNISLLYIETGQYSKALEHLNAELEFKEKTKKSEEIIPVLITIASVQNELGQYGKAAEKIQSAIAMSQELNSLPLLRRSYGIAANIYSNWGKQQESQQYFELYSTIDKKLKDDRMAAVESEAEEKVTIAYSEKAKTEQELSIKSEELKQTAESLEEAERIARQQKLELDLQQSQINEATALLKVERLKKTLYAGGFSILLIFVIVLVFLIIRIRKANIKINNQRLKLEKQNREINSSIRYAKTIQNAMLPDMTGVEKFASYFMVYRPKDIVSGDFYWSSIISEKRMFVAVVDCTGHGVPGAFMSMIGIRMLDEIVNEMKIESPAHILETLNDLLRNALKQEQTDNNDGMDLCVCRFDKLANGKVEMTYSGAKRPAYIGRITKLDIEILDPDRKSIGGYQPAKRLIEFTDQVTTLEKNDVLFLFSDGIVDQNDPFRKKFGRARLESIFKSIIADDSKTQGEVIESKLDEFIKNEAQRDDITVAGFKIA